MCDYSLHGVASRPARVGDELVTTRFWNTHTRGFATVAERSVAVCLRPGTEVAFESEVRYRRTLVEAVFSREKKRPLLYKVARFKQIDVDRPHTHHDALEFPDGQVVLLTRLRTGQCAHVLQLPATDKYPGAATSMPSSHQTASTF